MDIGNENHCMNKPYFTLGDISIINTSVDDFILLAQSSDFILRTGKNGRHSLEGKYLKENVLIDVYPSTNGQVAAIHIYFSSFSNLKEAVSSCDHISEQIEELYEVDSTTYFFDTDNFTNKYDKKQIKKIKSAIMSKKSYEWLTAHTNHEMLLLSLVKVDYDTKESAFGFILKVMTKKHVQVQEISVFAGNVESLFALNIREKRNNMFLSSYLWKKGNCAHLVSPVGVLEMVPQNQNDLSLLYSYYKEDIYKFNDHIQESFFQVQKDFVSGKYYDLSDRMYSKYAFILFFSILDAFQYNKNVSDFIDQIEVLCLCCPKITNYIPILMRPEYQIWQQLNDVSKLQILNWHQTLDIHLPILDYSQFILQKKQNDIEMLRLFSGYTNSVSVFTIGKKDEKKNHITSQQLIRESIELLLVVLRKIGGIDSFVYKKIKTECIGNREPLDNRELHKIKYIYAEEMKNICILDFVIKSRNFVYHKNGVAKVYAQFDFPWHCQMFARFDKYFEEACSEYYQGRES